MKFANITFNIKNDNEKVFCILTGLEFVALKI